MEFTLEFLKWWVTGEMAVIYFARCNDFNILYTRHDRKWASVFIFFKLLINFTVRKKINVAGPETPAVGSSWFILCFTPRSIF